MHTTGDTLFYTSDYFWLLSFGLGRWQQLDTGLANVINEDQSLWYPVSLFWGE